jgi:rhodanese-related sulfurtransferase
MVIALSLLALVYGLYRYAMDSPYRVSSDDAKKLIKNNKIDLILDVRTDAELSLFGAYPGSIHIQSADLEAQMTRRYPDKTIRILAYCNSGQRARAATEKLRALGYSNTLYIAGTYQSLL